MRTWKCEYCGRKNPNERIDCRKCGCDRPDDGINLWGNYDYQPITLSNELCNASFTQRIYSTASSWID